ncbi:MAG: hypothetical protein M3Q48_09380 [Actinomycetota bacterium]|nr:hypothetical protein [Actinomycetota bacterium]
MAPAVLLAVLLAVVMALVPVLKGPSTPLLVLGFVFFAMSVPLAIVGVALHHRSRVALLLTALLAVLFIAYPPVSRWWRDIIVCEAGACRRDWEPNAGVMPIGYGLVLLAQVIMVLRAERGPRNDRKRRDRMAASRRLSAWCWRRGLTNGQRRRLTSRSPWVHMKGH